LRRELELRQPSRLRPVMGVTIGPTSQTVPRQAPALSGTFGVYRGSRRQSSANYSGFTDCSAAKHFPPGSLLLRSARPAPPITLPRRTLGIGAVRTNRIRVRPLRRVRLSYTPFTWFFTDMSLDLPSANTDDPVGTNHPCGPWSTPWARGRGMSSIPRPPRQSNRVPAPAHREKQRFNGSE